MDVKSAQRISRIVEIICNGVNHGTVGVEDDIAPAGVYCDICN